jgi:50S ribosomal subunit-associated GTPase HflX
MESILAGLGLTPDDNTVVISAVKGQGLPRLLEMISRAVAPASPGESLNQAD